MGFTLMESKKNNIHPQTLGGGWSGWRERHKMEEKVLHLPGKNGPGLLLSCVAKKHK